jgi:hypothetical protein
MDAKRRIFDIQGYTTNFISLSNLIVKSLYLYHNNITYLKMSKKYFKKQFFNSYMKKDVNGISLLQAEKIMLWIDEFEKLFCSKIYKTSLNHGHGPAKILSDPDLVDADS